MAIQVFKSAPGLLSASIKLDLFDVQTNVLRKLIEDMSEPFEMIRKKMYTMIHNHFYKKENPEGPWASLSENTEYLRLKGISKWSKPRRPSPGNAPLMATFDYYYALSYANKGGHIFKPTGTNKRIWIGTSLWQNYNEDERVNASSAMFAGAKVPKRSVLWFDDATIDDISTIIDKYMFNKLTEG